MLPVTNSASSADLVMQERGRVPDLVAFPQTQYENEEAPSLASKKFTISQSSRGKKIFITLSLLSSTIFLLGVICNQYVKKHVDWFLLVGATGSYAGTIGFTLSELYTSKKVSKQKANGEPPIIRQHDPKSTLLLILATTGITLLGILLSTKTIKISSITTFTKKATLYGGMATLTLSLISYVYGKYVDFLPLNHSSPSKTKSTKRMVFMMVLFGMLIFGLASKKTTLIFKTPPSSDPMKAIINFCYFTGAYAIGTSALALFLLGLIVLVKQRMEIRRLESKRDVLRATLRGRPELEEMSGMAQSSWWSSDREIELQQEINTLSTLTENRAYI